MTARNRTAFERGQRARAELREILASHPPLLPPLTLAELQVQLADRGVFIAVQTIAWHRARMWRESAQTAEVRHGAT
jgi:hypothetical protein